MNKKTKELVIKITSILGIILPFIGIIITLLLFGFGCFLLFGILPIFGIYPGNMGFEPGTVQGQITQLFNVLFWIAFINSIRANVLRVFVWLISAIVSIIALILNKRKIPAFILHIVAAVFAFLAGDYLLTLIDATSSVFLLIREKEIVDAEVIDK